MSYLSIVFISFLVASCSMVKSDQLTPTLSPFIGEQQAIELGIKTASIPHPELSPAKVPPTNVKAELKTFAEAKKRLTGHEDDHVGYYDPNLLVWYITMDGLWTDEFPRPTNEPTPEPLYHFRVILDAKTGQEMMVGARR
jgi:hypothetical protein